MYMAVGLIIIGLSLCVVTAGFVARGQRLTKIKILHDEYIKANADRYRRLRRNL